ncbi:uncharacterized protein LOC115881789 isoform X2 [Sitophilus oryzae]|uniref:Uncharacterized protein LOC115881789 isoform X2 n=1 Tax=Sitophilus oryzae TaxID=7048 RepID=A0A6J2XXE5_SITOR|nr:uncharacterized protein LOC115881789 isoform X2 [Sitophilus oryzae]
MATSTESVKKICDIIEERDLEIFQKEVKIKYLSDLIKKVKNETLELERTKKKIEEVTKSMQSQIDQLDSVHISIKTANEVITKCLVNYGTYETLLAKDQEAQEQNEIEFQNDFNKAYTTIQNHQQSNELYQKFLNAKYEYLRLDIERREIKFQNTKLRRMSKERLEIIKQIFYNYYIDLAKEYVEQHRKDKGNTIAKETKNKNTVEIGQDVKIQENKKRSLEPELFSKRISEILKSEEEIEIVPTKIRILEDSIIVPPLDYKAIVEESKQKMKKIDMASRWKNILKSGKSNKDISRSNIFSQESFIQSQLNESQVSLSQQAPLVQANASQKVDSNPIVINNQQGPLNSNEALSVPPKTVNENVPGNVKKHAEPSQLSMGHGYKQASVPLPNSQRSTRPSQGVKMSPMMSQKAALPQPSELSKSVRFNVGPVQTETKQNFGGSSFMGNTYSSFFTRPPVQQNPGDDMKMEYTGNNSMANMSALDFTDVNSAEDMPGMGNSIVLSPEFSYNLDQDPTEQDVPASSPPIQPQRGPSGRSEGFFSFGIKNIFDPFRSN